ncbi:uncharacterized protein MELLADRAFT_65007 [Melampsora larici-populina 98AG31]|uniref:Uncharacterized protein n=1 Tax=Melampsora larici-populina (strain 98AG31 / pathotype 3-4-7) TaxID=747676 RepID=F4RTM2_MELLP|nr:uncharacterized protein MELLADRAFT_65007 [Melampsora larici-populina 98AG31]EGG04314.1 hypothetical protein MELLADRAFT_65007 [Melampsora larici-populina 98AG31]
MAINQQELQSQTINGHSDLNPIAISEIDSVLSMEVKIDQLDDFVWEEEYQEILNSFTSTGLPNPKHSQINSTLILKIILSNLKLIIQNYLRFGERILIDAKDEVGHHSGNWNPNDTQNNLNQITTNLLNFSSQSTDQESINNRHLNQLSIEEFNRIQNIPFTIQRLSELVSVPQLRPTPNDPKLGIHPHYLTLPKYLRAIQRVLSVTSPITYYSINTFTLPDLTEPEPNPTNLLNGSQISSNLNGDLNSSNMMNPTVRPTAIRQRRPSTSTPITPVLSPIQWLINAPLVTADPSRSRQSSPLISLSPTDERPITPPLGTHPISLKHNDHLNSGPRIDEVDMGNGNGDEMLDDPVELSNTDSGHQNSNNEKIDEDDQMKENDLKE